MRKTKQKESEPQDVAGIWGDYRESRGLKPDDIVLCERCGRMADNLQYMKTVEPYPLNLRAVCRQRHLWLHGIGSDCRHEGADCYAK